MRKMKLHYLLFTALFIACNKSKVETKSAIEPEKMEVQKTTLSAIDSVSVNDSVKVNENLVVAFKSKALVFENIKNKGVLDSIYAVKNIDLDEYTSENILTALKKQQQNYFEQNKKDASDLVRDFAQTWYENSDMKVHSNENNLLTIQYTSDGFSGGAHGFYNETYKVFDLKENKTVQLSDILMTPDSNIWKRALMDNFLKSDAGKGQSEMLLVKEISPNNNFYFDKENLYFLYNQYEITAYAAGPVLIKIPFSDIKLMVKPEFLKRIAVQ